MSKKSEDLLIEQVATFRYDPYGFVLFAFPWLEPGELADEAGPRKWQVNILKTLGDELRKGRELNEAVRISVASGHGIGKSALVSWLIWWALSTQPDTKLVVTANTENQLRTKTWPEVRKWARMAINSHWFDPTQTAIMSVDEAHASTWRCDAIPWSEHNTEAFAGLHNKGRRLGLIFDEASNIADKVWEVAEGALTDTDTDIFWCAFGNPTRNTGRFREAFGRLRHRWDCVQIDSRTVEGANLKQSQEWVDDYGEDSDFVRVRVKGQFPRAGSMQFIPSDLVNKAVENGKAGVSGLLTDPLIMGIDVARFGDDQSVIRFRRGRDAHSIMPRKYRGVDTMKLAGEAATLIETFRPDAVFVDETGIGGAVVDRLRQLGHHVVGVNNGAVSDCPIEGMMVRNKGAELWARMREWMKAGGAIDDDAELMTELESREYGYDANNKIVLEKKSDMKKRGLGSPDQADGLSLTFAYPVGERGSTGRMGKVIQAQTEWNPYADA